MQSRTWISLLRRIPDELHESLVIVTSLGTEICIQSVVRMEPEYLVIRGRLAGSTEGGRVFFIPFNNVDHILLQKEMKEPQIQAICRSPAADASLEAHPVRESPSHSQGPPAKTPAADNSSTATARREAVLQRLRGRLPSSPVKPDNP